MIGQRYRRFTSSVAIFAVLLMAIAPTLTHAFAAKSAAPWQELCTAQGLKLADSTVDDNKSQPQPAKNHHAGDCPFCGTHVQNVGVEQNTSLAFNFSHQVVLATWIYQAPAIVDYHQLSNPSQAPPVA